MNPTSALAWHHHRKPRKKVTRRHVDAWETSTKARFEAGAKTVKLRRFKEFYDGAARWSRVERIIARVEAGEAGTDTRFIVTNLEGGRAKKPYQNLYCRRGCAENHIKSNGLE